MLMHVTCPTCSDSFPIVAGFLEADGKRFGMLLASMDPTLGKAAVDYLSLFAPAKQKLRLSRAVKIVAALDALVREGSVCRDERTDVRRQASVANWVAGIEQMLEQRGRLTLPLLNHNYLRSVVFGIAEQAAASKEHMREQNARAGRARPGTGVSPPTPPEDPQTRDLKWLDQLHDYGQLSDEEWDRQRAETIERYRARS
jgi:hypothetical protein